MLSCLLYKLSDLDPYYLIIYNYVNSNTTLHSSVISEK